MEFISNFNGLELIFIIILALLLFGPERIPEIAGRLGTWARKLRDFSAGFMASISQEAGLDQLSDEGQELTETLQDTASQMRSAAGAIQAPVRSLGRSLSSSLSAEDKEAGSSGSASPENKVEKKSVDQRENLQKRLASLEDELQEIRSALQATDQQEGDDPADD